MYQTYLSNNFSQRRRFKRTKTGKLTAQQPKLRIKREDEWEVEEEKKDDVPLNLDMVKAREKKLGISAALSPGGTLKVSEDSAVREEMEMEEELDFEYDSDGNIIFDED